MTFDIALVQEPNTTANGKISLLQTTRCWYSKGQRPRAGVIISGEIDHWPNEPLSTRDLAVVALDCKAQKKTIYVASCYLDILGSAPSEELDRLVEYCQRNKVPLIVGIDSNAHSTTWGETSTNRRGGDLDEWLMRRNLHIMNKGRVPTFYPENGAKSTIIDITITNDLAVHLVENWKVKLEEVSLSDHRIISYSFQSPLRKEVPLFRNIRKVNWDKFKDALSKIPMRVLIPTIDVNMITDSIVENINEIIDTIAPRHSLKVSTTDSWWTESLTLKRKILRNLYSKRLRHPKVLEKYKVLKRELKQEITKARSSSWQNFCSKADSAKEISKVVRILENPPRRMMSLLTEEGKVLTPRTSVRHLLHVHFPDGSFLEQGSSPHEQDTAEDTDFTGVCQFITIDKIQAAFASFGDYKSAGPDGLPPIVWKNVTDNVLRAVQVLYQLSLAEGKIPDSWRKMNVVFIPKVGKADYATAKAYRPITLSNFLLKGLERLVQWYMLNCVITRPLERQHAYTKGRSCDTALSTFVNDVEKAIYTKEYVLAVSLDCSGAFDCIQFGSAKESMIRKGTPDNIIRWYCNLLRAREVTANVQGVKTTILPARGSPQGGVLSPLIWNLIIDEILTRYRDGPVKILGYADDILIYTSGKVASTLVELLQPALDEVISWGSNNGLTFNPNKTKAVLFRKYQRVPRIPPLKVKGMALELENSFKYLGVELHKNLSWVPHVMERTNKCKYLLSKCKSIIGKTWGLTPDKMEWVHSAVVRPKMAYGSIVWSSKMTNTMQLQMDRVQRLSLLSIIHPLRSAPTRGLEAMMGWIPLHLHVQKTGMMAFLRNRTIINPRWEGRGLYKGLKGHLRRWNEAYNKQARGDRPIERTVKGHIWRDSRNPAKGPHGPLKIYTDASKDGENVGISFIVCDGDYIIEERTLPAKEISVHHAEMIAIKEALSWLKYDLQDGLERPLEIYSDSLSAVTAINGYEPKDSTSQEAMLLLKDMERVTLTWVKGHSDITGNEAADMLAKEGVITARQLMSVSPYMPLSYKALKKLVGECYTEVWQECWDRLTDCKISRLFITEVTKLKVSSAYSSGELQKLSHIITGHGLFKRHLRHWNELPDNNFLCTLCGEDWENSWHLWALCPALALERAEIGNHINTGLPRYRGILKFFENDKIKKLMALNEALLTPD